MRLPLIRQAPPMPSESACRETTFGYLSALETVEHGFFGGYLLIARSGRPLEFHCTSPVQPNRAQQILYGPTLRPCLLGEQIGGTLVEKAAITPQLILTDQAAVLSLRSQIEVPIVFVVGLADSDSYLATGSEDASIPAVFGTWAEPQLFCVDGNRCELARGYESDRESVAMLLTELARHVELIEPFGRIHEAIREAQRIGEEGPEIHGQAA